MIILYVEYGGIYLEKVVEDKSNQRIRGMCRLKWVHNGVWDGTVKWYRLAH